MLLSASPFPFHTYSYNPTTYTPLMSSPLAERSANAVPHRPIFTFSMASSSKRDTVPVSKRAHKPNPVIPQSRDAQTQRRREMFFKRVRSAREEGKWEGRGEQLERLDFLSDQKRWEAAKARQAAQEFRGLDDYLLEEENAATQHADHQQSFSNPERDQEAAEADWVLAQEDRELQELVAAMEEQSQRQGQDGAAQGYGSDEEEYDNIFMECVSRTEFAQAGQGQSVSANEGFDGDAMDMTDG